jgi:hypothetical protein
MAVSSDIRKAGPYTGNGSTVTFPFAFKLFSADQLVVIRTVTGVETTLTLTADYTVALNADQDANPGGVMTMLVAPPVGHIITLTSDLANLQPTVLTNLGGFYPEVINDSLDRATIQIQQVDERLDRTLILPISTSGVSTQLPAPVPGKILGWNASGSALINYNSFGAATYVGAFAFILQASVNVIRLLADGNLSPSTVTFSAFEDDGAGSRIAYAGRFEIETSVDGAAYTSVYVSSVNESTTTYTVPSGANFVRCKLFRADDFAEQLQQFTVSVIRDGTDGLSGSGTDPITVNLSKSSAAVFAYADGTVPSFADIDGQVTVFDGTSNQTAAASFAVAGSGLTGEINTADGTPVAGKPKGYFRVTAMSADIGALVITTTYGGVDYVRSFSVSKIKTGYEIVATLPSTNLFEGRLVFLTTDDKLYRYTGTAWTKAVDTTDLSGEIVAAQIADAALTTAKFAAGIEPVTIVSSVPGTKSTSSIFNTTDGFLYRWNGSAYVKSVPTTDLSGTVSDSQIAALAAAKITGTLTSAQIADLAATKITGTLTSAQIADLAAAKITGTIAETQIANDAVTSAKINAGAVTTAKLAAAAVTADIIASNAVTAAKINAGAVTTAKLAAGAVTADTIATNAITAVKISAGAVETAKIAAGAVTATQIAAGTITAGQIAAGTITATQIASGTITATQIASDTITAGQIAAGAISTSELAAGAVTATKIAAGTITTNEIAANTITAGDIAAATITATQLATNAVTADKISAGAVTAAKISVTNLAAMTANTGNLSVNGTLTLSSSGKLITTGTTYNTNGIFLGDDSGTYKFSIGGTSGRLTFDGTNLALPGGRIVDGSVSASKISVTNLSAISADLGSITAGKLSLTSGSYVVRHGAGFGASSDLVLWYGLASVAEASATKTNGVFALATDGKVYYGAAELATGITPITVTRTSGDFVNVKIGSGTNNTGSVTFSASGGSGTITFAHALVVTYTTGPSASVTSATGSTTAVTASGSPGDEVNGFVITTATDAASNSVQFISPVYLAWET